MAENNNERLSRRDKHSTEKKTVMPGGYISRKNINSSQMNNKDEQ